MGTELFDLLERDYPEPKPEAPVVAVSIMEDASRPELAVLWKSVAKEGRNWIRWALDTNISDLEGGAKDIRRQVGTMPAPEAGTDPKTQEFLKEARERQLMWAEKNEHRATAWRAVRAFVSEMDGKIGVSLVEKYEHAAKFMLEP